MEHVLDCEVEFEKEKYNIRSSIINQWNQMLKIFRESQNKKRYKKERHKKEMKERQN